MGDMTYEGLGSQIHLLVPDIPDAISGAALLNIIDRKRDYVERYTGLTAGSPTITVRFQSIIVNFTISELLRFQSLQGVKVASVSLGDFSVNKGSSSAVADASELYRLRAEDELKFIGRRVDFYTAY